MKKITLISLTFLIIVSCTNNNPIPTEPTPDATPITLRVGLQKRVNQDNEFAFDLLRKTIDVSNESNVFISPLSVSIALGMTWNGASSDTKTEMETALKMNSLTATDINEYYKVMQSTLPQIDPTTALSISNSLWYKTGFAVKPDFLKINSDNFNAYIKELDFAQAWAVDTINNWCSKQTKKLIPTILDNIPKEAVMYLANAVYFKGIWRSKFDKDQTIESNFTNEANNQVKVNMMYQKDTFSYAIDNDAQYLDLPYGNKAFSMTVVLPASNKSTADILSNLSVDNWNATLNSMKEREVMVYLPRFKVENKFSLKQELIDMGMNKAFSDAADFTNISNEKLSISDVIHKTYVTVDEDGTEAAAVTIIGIITTSMPDYPVFRVDKPFIFVIREKSTGVILFIGKIGNPAKY